MKCKYTASISSAKKWFQLKSQMEVLKHKNIEAQPSSKIIFMEDSCLFMLQKKVWQIG